MAPKPIKPTLPSDGILRLPKRARTSATDRFMFLIINNPTQVDVIPKPKNKSPKVHAFGVFFFKITINHLSAAYDHG
jgi:hypothetical protein